MLKKMWVIALLISLLCQAPAEASVIGGIKRVVLYPFRLSKNLVISIYEDTKFCIWYSWNYDNYGDWE